MVTDVWLHLIDTTMGMVSEETTREMHRRRKVGLDTYGRPLAPYNGRDNLRDELDEALDGLAYAWQRHLEGCMQSGTRVYRHWLPLVIEMVEQRSTRSPREKLRRMLSTYSAQRQARGAFRYDDMPLEPPFGDVTGGEE